MPLRTWLKSPAAAALGTMVVKEVRGRCWNRCLSRGSLVIRAHMASMEGYSSRYTVSSPTLSGWFRLPGRRSSRATVSSRWASMRLSLIHISFVHICDAVLSFPFGLYLMKIF